MDIELTATCHCGTMLSFHQESAGSRRRCPSCGADVVLVPGPQPSSPSPAVGGGPPDKASGRGYRFLLAALLPLFASTIAPTPEEPLQSRFARSLQKAPPDVQREADAIIKKYGLSRSVIKHIAGMLPEGKIDGALLPVKGTGQYVYAALATAAFLAATLAVFPRGGVRPANLVVAGAFTGTIGIVLLLFAQDVADNGLPAFGQTLTILSYIAKFIKFSYDATNDTSGGFLKCLLGFTCGVGFCEELCKLLPLLYVVRKVPRFTDWRSLCALGFASGAGFGISEGVHYSAHMYNGISTGEIYVVRFVSCAALHGIWCAAVALVLAREKATLQGPASWAMLVPLVKIMAVPMALHGLYDNLLTFDHPIVALVVAFASFRWLGTCLERAKAADLAVT